MAARSMRVRRAPPVEIREATARDLPAVARLGAKLARAHHAWDRARFFAPEEPLEAGYAWWLGKERGNPRAAVLAALLRGRIVGYAYGRIEPRDWNLLRDRCGVGVDIWVEPRARRSGIGSALLEALAAALAARGAPRIVIYVAARNGRAARLFGARGFRPTMLELTREVGGAARPPRRRAVANPRSRTARPRIDRRQSKDP